MLSLLVFTVTHQASISCVPWIVTRCFVAGGGGGGIDDIAILVTNQALLRNQLDETILAHCKDRCGTNMIQAIVQS